MKRGTVILTVIVMLVLAFGVMVYYVSKQSATARIGQEAPDFQLESVDGEKLSLADFHGQFLVVNFFTTWCPPCLEEQPELQRFHEKYGNQVKLLMIDRAEPRALVEAFIRKFNATSLFLLDGNNRVSKMYGVVGQPETLFINEQGTLLYHHIGPMTEDTIVDTVNQLRSEKLRQ
jgi:thiol-disulfide isomerase/thioredoxin